jgi:hypothetical protein
MTPVGVQYKRRIQARTLNILQFTQAWVDEWEKVQTGIPGRSIGCTFTV